MGETDALQEGNATAKSEHWRSKRYLSTSCVDISKKNCQGASKEYCIVESAPSEGSADSKSKRLLIAFNPDSKEIAKACLTK